MTYLLEKVLLGVIQLFPLVDFLLLLRKIDKVVDYTKINEYRRHVALITEIDGQRIEVHLDEIQEYQALVLTTSAEQADKDYAHAKKESALGKRISGHEEDCETLMQEAIGLID